MAIKFAPRNASNSVFTIKINGQETEWGFGRVTAMEEAQIAVDLQPLMAHIQRDSALYFKHKNLLDAVQAATDEAGESGEGFAPTPEQERALEQVLAIAQEQHPPSPDELAPVYTWLARKLTSISGFELADGTTLQLGALDEEGREELVGFLSHDHALTLLEKVRAASHLSSEALGKFIAR